MAVDGLGQLSAGSFSGAPSTRCKACKKEGAATGSVNRVASGTVKGKTHPSHVRGVTRPHLHNEFKRFQFRILGQLDLVLAFLHLIFIGWAYPSCLQECYVLHTVLL